MDLAFIVGSLHHQPSVPPSSVAPVTVLSVAPVTVLNLSGEPNPWSATATTTGLNIFDLWLRPAFVSPSQNLQTTRSVASLSQTTATTRCTSPTSIFTCLLFSLCQDQRRRPPEHHHCRPSSEHNHCRTSLNHHRNFLMSKMEKNPVSRSLPSYISETPLKTQVNRFSWWWSQPQTTIAISLSLSGFLVVGSYQ